MGLVRGILNRIARMAEGSKKTPAQNKAAELSVILDHIPMAVYWKDTDFVYRGGNSQFESMSGVTRHELPGKTDMDLHVREVADRFRQEDREFVGGRRKSMYFTDKLVPMKNASPMWARTYKIPVLDDDSNLVYIMGLIQDVTKVKQAEIALAESESRLRTVLDATADHIVFVDAAGKILVANHSFLRDFGLVKDETVDKQLQDLVAPQLYERFMESGRLAGERNEPIRFDLLPGESPMGRYLDVSFYPVRAEGKNIGTAIFAKDITESKRTEEMLVKHGEQLQIAMTEAENASKSKSDFLSRMSHEIRTPLNAIIGMAKIAGNSEDHEKIRDCLEKIDSSSKHLLGIINDVLDMSKIEADKFVLSDTVFRLEDTLKDIANVISVQADEKRQDFEVILDPALPEYFNADELRLRQVITNLLSNAVKFTPEYGTVRLGVNYLGAEDGRSGVEVVVSDTGIGITPEQQERLFQPFEQAEGGIARKYGGTGLGLAICKKIVEMMGGRIWAESGPESGSRFLFRVKMKAQSSGEKEACPVIEFADMYALVVDDSLETREYLSHILESFGICSQTVESGYEAVEQVKEAKEKGRPFNVFFVDWSMPGLDGIETTKKIKAVMSDNSVVIMISITEWDRIEKEATEAGVARFIAKPLFPSVVLGVLNEIAGTAVKRAIKTDPKGIPNLAGYRILLAEDIAINREIAAVILESTQVELDFAENGREAVAMFRADPDRYDLILMDIHMPEMDGYEATKLIRAGGDGKSLKIPIIAMTADAFKEDIEKCKAVGMNDHVAKPINERELFQKILICRNSPRRHKSGAHSLPAPGKGGDGAQASYIHEENALKRLDGNKKLYKKLLQSFVEDPSRRRLTESIRAGDMQGARLAAHAVKGMAANLSLDAVYEQAVRLDAAPGSDGAAPDALRDFENAVDETIREIEEYMKRG